MFRTELNIDPHSWKITLSSKVFSIGSCFAVHIGQLLQDNKFDAVTNPFGTLFNPHSIYKLLNLAIANRPPADWTFIEHQGVYRNLLVHSSISSTDKEAVAVQMQDALIHTQNYLRDADYIILTFGSAVAYSWHKNDEIVGNCHKLPAFLFTKNLLEIDQIVEEFQELYNALKIINSNIKFIITVSPVRHIRDNLVANSLSKSVLRVAANKIEQRLQDALYFPSYELVLDDLRDYRFYNEDMVHPNNQAIKYVWDKFAHMFFDEETRNFLSEWSGIRKAIEHKPFNPHSEAHQEFIHKTIDKLVRLQKIINVDKELTALKQQQHEQYKTKSPRR